MKQHWAVATGEWTHLGRTRLAQLAFVLMLLLVLVSALLSTFMQSSEAARREAYQQEADETFRSQPDRHPHRMVHYGHYVFRVPAPLAVIDPGVDPFTGHSIFLEGHRRNTATFAEARETSILTRFGMLSPAFTLQVLVPLLLILIGFASVARERRGGFLTQLLAQGLSPRSLLAGKTLALGAIAGVALLPMLFTSFWLVITGRESMVPVLMMLAGYGLYLAFWVLAIVLASALANTPRAALTLLISAWALTSVLMPRVAADMAAALVPVPTLAEVDIMIHDEMRRLGDSHNVDDPAFTSLREQVLAEYGVEREEDLPINYRGLVSYENEAAGSAMMDRYAAERSEQQQAQSSVIRGFAWLSPYLAIRELSMAGAGTDLRNHQRFLEAAEAHRYHLVQSLNTLHTHELAYADDVARSRDQEAEQRTRVSAAFWAEMQDFQFAPATPGERALAAMPMAGVLLAWLALMALLMRIARRGISLS